MANQYQLGMREKGVSVPISIGTALAVEAALGVYPDQPQSPPPVRRYKAVWCNLYTFFRNLYGTLSAEDQRGVLPVELLAALKEDVLGAEFALKQHAPAVEVVFYLNDYHGLARRFPHASLKKPSTQLQLAYAELEAATLERFIKDPPVAVSSDNLLISGNHPASLILTHYAVDLLARYQFAQLDLLESHSGKIKRPPQWNTKLGLKDGIEHIPFNAFTLQVFGDRSTQFMPQPLALRRAVVQLAETRRWTPVTSVSLMRSHVEAAKDPHLELACKPFW